MKGEDLGLVAVIMAGGVGTRFWPLSTERKPKQFLKLFGDRSLLQKSYDRVAGLIPPERVVVLTGVAYADLVMEQLPEIPRENVIAEPMRRDTAAAVCLGAVLCRKRFGNPVIATLTSDHIIEPVQLFQDTLVSAARQARQRDVLYTFGVKPSNPATGYGYLELGKRVAEDRGVEHFQLLGFKEKPDAETAKRYVSDGRFYWNSGMFVWTADTILSEIATYLPRHVDYLTMAADYDMTPMWPKALNDAFQALDSISIDYAVMEKARDIRCVAAKFSWTDVGGWSALRAFLPEDESGNRCQGQMVTLNAESNMVFCDDPQEMVMLVGVEDLVIVRTAGKTLITHKDRTEEIKKLVNNLPGD